MRLSAGDQKGIKLALDARGGTNEVEDPQPDLLGLPVNRNVIRLREAKGVGRPAGARNKRTVEMAAYLLNRYTSPLEVLAQIATTPIDELCASLACTKLEALQEVRLAALGLVPYLHSKMPVAVDVTNHKVVHLTIEMGDTSDAPALTRRDSDVLSLSATVVDMAEKDDDESGAA